MKYYKLCSNFVSFKADSHIACRAHAVLLPCLAAEGLECVFPIWYTQCGRVWLTLAMPRPCHALTMPWPWEELHGQSMASVNQTRSHCVYQMGKTHSKPSAARRGRGTAWAWHAICESAFSVPLCCHRQAYKTSGEMCLYVLTFHIL
jgi:hypothetical protein